MRKGIDIGKYTLYELQKLVSAYVPRSQTIKLMKEREAVVREYSKTKISLVIRACKGEGSPLVFKCGTHGYFACSINTFENRIKKNKPLCPVCETRRQEEELQQNGIPLYHKHGASLTVEEEPQSDIHGELTVLCANQECRERFTPTLQSTFNRIYALEGKSYAKGEKRLYCSDNCKKTCEIYGKNPIIHGDHRLPREKDQRFRLPHKIRTIVTQRSDWICEKCGGCPDDDNFEIHHIHPRATHPELATDPENLIHLCRSCHLEAHKEIGCTFGQLAKAARIREEIDALF